MVHLNVFQAVLKKITRQYLNVAICNMEHLEIVVNLRNWFEILFPIQVDFFYTMLKEIIRKFVDVTTRKVKCIKIIIDAWNYIQISVVV